MILFLLFCICLFAKPSIAKRNFLSKDEQFSTYSKLLSNEFELISPQNILSGFALNEQQQHRYVITSISNYSINNDGLVFVSYYSNNPSTGDWIGAYSPEYVNIMTSVPVKFGWCDESPNYNITGLGSLSFNFTNLRADIRFYYFSNSLYNPIMRNVSSFNLTFNNFNEPLRPRVVATGNW